jgi:hypothetical protein
MTDTTNDITALIAAFADYDGTHGITDEMIDDALLATLAELTDTDGEPIAWARLRKHLPGHTARHGESLVRLWQDYRLDVIKIDGLNYVIANDALDDRIAAVERARRPRRPRTLTVLYT